LNGLEVNVDTAQTIKISRSDCTIELSGLVEVFARRNVVPDKMAEYSKLAME
jgi:hypothetical protein